MKGNRPVIYGDGTQTRDFTFVEDVVQGNILAMRSERDFGLYNVGTGIGTSFNEILNIINKHLDKKKNLAIIQDGMWIVE